MILISTSALSKTGETKTDSSTALYSLLPGIANPPLLDRREGFPLLKLDPYTWDKVSDEIFYRVARRASTLNHLRSCASHLSLSLGLDPHPQNDIPMLFAFLDSQRSALAADITDYNSPLIEGLHYFDSWVMETEEGRFTVKSERWSSFFADGTRTFNTSSHLFLDTGADADADADAGADAEAHIATPTPHALTDVRLKSPAITCLPFIDGETNTVTEMTVTEILNVPGWRVDCKVHELFKQ